MTDSAFTTVAPSGSPSDDLDFSAVQSPYNSVVVWPDEYTRSLEKPKVYEAFKKTCKKLLQAGCKFLLLEPTEISGSFFCFFSCFIHS